MNVKLLFFSVTNQIRTYLRSHDRMAKKLDTFFFQKKSDHFDLKRYYEHLQFKTQMPTICLEQTSVIQAISLQYTGSFLAWPMVRWLCNIGIFVSKGFSGL